MVGDEARNLSGLIRSCGGGTVGCRGRVYAGLGSVGSVSQAHF